MEDALNRKQGICTYLLWALQLTRVGTTLKGLQYVPEKEIVIAKFWPPGQAEVEREINVAADSGTAMIKDIIRALE